MAASAHAQDSERTRDMEVAFIDPEEHIVILRTTRMEAFRRAARISDVPPHEAVYRFMRSCPTIMSKRDVLSLAEFDRIKTQRMPRAIDSIDRLSGQRTLSSYPLTRD